MKYFPSGFPITVSPDKHAKTVQHYTYSLINTYSKAIMEVSSISVGRNKA